MAGIEDEAIVRQGCMILILNEYGLAGLYVSGRLRYLISFGLRACETEELTTNKRPY